MIVSDEVNVRTRISYITQWYIEVFPQVAAFVQKRGGDLEDAKEIFQETIISYYEKTIRSDFTPERSDQAYIFGIAKKKWLKYSSGKVRCEDIADIELVEDSKQVPLSDKIFLYLKRAGEKCMDLLQAFYYEKLTMRQLSERYGYTSERSATVQKYKCLEKVRNEVKNKSLSYEDFVD